MLHRLAIALVAAVSLGVAAPTGAIAAHGGGGGGHGGGGGGHGGGGGPSGGHSFSASPGFSGRGMPGGNAFVNRGVSAQPFVNEPWCPGQHPLCRAPGQQRSSFRLDRSPPRSWAAPPWLHPGNWVRLLLVL
jgi:hypothetical protein